MVNILIIAGPSAVGKSTLAEELLKMDSRFSFLRSVTTRAPRGDGRDGEYLYLSREEFQAAVSRGEILEHTEYAGTLYGTPRSEVVRVTEEGRIPLLILDLEGVRSLSNAKGIGVAAIYVYDTLSVMENRLYERFLKGSDTEDNRLKYDNRISANLYDYGRITEYKDCFYAFVRNSDSISEVAARILSEYCDFEIGLPTKQSSVEEALRFIYDDLAENSKKCK